MKGLWCSALMCFAAAAGPAAAKPAMLAVTEPMPVFQVMKNGQVSGSNSELVRQVLAQAELKAEFQMYPWARAYSLALQQPNVLIYAITKTTEREALFHWIGPIASFRLGFVRLKGNQQAGIKTLQDAKQLTIAVQRQDSTFGWLISQGFAEQKQLVLAADAEQSWSLLANGKVDLIVENPVLLPELARKTDLTLQQLELVLMIPELEQQAYLAVSKSTAPKTVEKLKQAYQQVVKP